MAGKNIIGKMKNNIHCQNLAEEKHHSCQKNQNHLPRILAHGKHKKIVVNVKKFDILDPHQNCIFCSGKCRGQQIILKRKRCHGGKKKHHCQNQEISSIHCQNENGAMAEKKHHCQNQKI